MADGFEVRIYNMVQNILDGFRGCTRLSDCYGRVADGLTREYVQENFSELVITDEAANNLQSVWRPVGDNSVFAFCCGFPILYAETFADIGAAAVERLALSHEILNRCAVRDV